MRGKLNWLIFRPSYQARHLHDENQIILQFCFWTQDEANRYTKLTNVSDIITCGLNTYCFTKLLPDLLCYYANESKDLADNWQANSLNINILEIGKWGGHLITFTFPQTIPFNDDNLVNPFDECSLHSTLPLLPESFVTGYRNHSSMDVAYLTIFKKSLLLMRKTDNMGTLLEIRVWECKLWLG